MKQPFRRRAQEVAVVAYSCWLCGAVNYRIYFASESPAEKAEKETRLYCISCGYITIQYKES